MLFRAGGGHDDGVFDVVFKEFEVDVAEVVLCTGSEAELFTRESLSTAGCTVFLQTGSCIFSEKSYVMSHGSHYKIFMIFEMARIEIFQNKCYQSV